MALHVSFVYTATTVATTRNCAGLTDQKRTLNLIYFDKVRADVALFQSCGCARALAYRTRVIRKTRGKPRVYTVLFRASHCSASGIP